MTIAEAKEEISDYEQSIPYGEWGIYKEDVEYIIDKIFNNQHCIDCKFRNDNKKCPMADPESMEDNNHCYNWSSNIKHIKES